MHEHYGHVQSVRVLLSVNLVTLYYMVVPFSVEYVPGSLGRYDSASRLPTDCNLVTLHVQLAQTLNAETGEIELW